MLARRPLPRVPSALLVVLLLPFLLFACAPMSPGGGEEVTRNGDLISGTGTVRYFDLEGGFYAIVGDDNVTYDPTNLAADFQKSDLRVIFRARLQENQVGFHQAGPIVEILEIRRK